MNSFQIPVYQQEIEQFCHRVVDVIAPDCVILHGSIVRGTYTAHSDVDIVVIGGHLPDNFLTRAYTLSTLHDGKAPLEVVAYTLAEWEQMMDSLHLTVLEALNWGVPLHGAAFLQQWQMRLEAWKARGLRRESTSWVVPPMLQTTS